MIERSHGKPRPRGLRKDRLPKSAAAELAAPFRDPSTGRFAAGNPGGRLRQVAALARATAQSLLRLTHPEVAPWLRGHLLDAQHHAQALVDALPTATDELVGLCADEARARLMASACVTEGARESCSPAEARAWREEARSWMREVRQIVLTRRAVSKDTDREDPLADLRRQQAEFQKKLAARTTSPNAALSTPTPTPTPSPTKDAATGQPEATA